MKIQYLVHNIENSILKVSVEGLSPKIRIYKSLDAMSNPDKFTHFIAKGYPSPDRLLVKLSTPIILNTTNSLYGLAIDATYEALIEWITNNPDLDPDFGKITDWTVISR